MLYRVGTRIDLSYLNKKVIPSRQKKSFEQKAQTVYIVGTRFVFRLTPSGLQAAIKIPVAYA